MEKKHDGIRGRMKWKKGDDRKKQKEEGQEGRARTTREEKAIKSEARNRKSLGASPGRNEQTGGHHVAMVRSLASKVVI